MQIVSRRLWWLAIALCLAVACRSAAPPTPLVTPLPLIQPTATTPARATPTLAYPGGDSSGATSETPPPTPSTGSGNGPVTMDIGDPYMPGLGATGFDVQRYTLRFSLDPSVRYAVGHATLFIVSRVDPLTELWLDLIGFDVKQVTVDGREATFRRQDQKLVVILPFARLAGTSFQVDVYYEGVPEPYASPFIPVGPLGLHYPGDGSLFAISEPDGARAWFPANDHPRDKASFRFELTVPAGKTAVANGLLVAEEAVGDNHRRFTWEHDYPMAPYLAVLAVGDFVRLDSVSQNGVPLRHYVAPADLERFQQYDGVNEEALAWLSERLGPYPFETYGYVTVALEGVSMETQTMVLLSSSMIGARTMVHELAHMWFGDWVSLDSWADMWRNEGFATYMQLLWEYRDDPEGLELEMIAIASAVEENGQDHALGEPPPALLFGFETYFEGAVLVHELRRELGDDAFWSGLRSYLERYGGSTASLAEFQAVMEAAAGRSLQAFFTARLQ